MRVNKRRRNFHFWMNCPFCVAVCYAWHHENLLNRIIWVIMRWHLSSNALYNMMWHSDPIFMLCFLLQRSLRAPPPGWVQVVRLMWHHHGNATILCRAVPPHMTHTVCMKGSAFTFQRWSLTPASKFLHFSFAKHLHTFIFWIALILVPACSTIFLFFQISSLL